MKKQAITLSLLTLTALPASAAIDCAVIPTCAELGYNDTVADCRDANNVLKCPFDKTLGKCLSNGAVVGQIAYFAKDPGDGWLPCNGNFYHKDKYPELYAKIGTMYGGGGDIFRLPPYARYDNTAFLRPSNSTGSSMMQGCAPNIKGTLGTDTDDTTSGAFSQIKKRKDYATGSDGVGFDLSFSASAYNSIYSDSCYAPTPNYYDVLTYIYAGKVGTPSTTAASLASGCEQGYYYYSDGTCSSTKNSSKTTLGKVRYVSKSSISVSISYVWGGGSSGNYAYAVNTCKQKPGGSIASLYDIKDANISTSYDSPIYAIDTSRSYWYMSTYSFTCTSTSPSSCSSKSGASTSDKHYFYCYGYDYLY